MSTEHLDPESYLDYHYGQKEQYPRLTTIAVMAAFSEAVVREIITPAFADQSKAFRQLLQVTANDPLYRTACEIKTRWMSEGVISTVQANTFGAFDIWVELMEGIPEDGIHPGMFIPGYSSDQGHKFNEN